MDMIGLGVVQFALGSAQDGKVVIDHSHPAPVNFTYSDDHPVGRGLPAGHIGSLGQLAQLEERAGIEQEVIPGPGR